jgi:hypothetical protein
MLKEKKEKRKKHIAYQLLISHINRLIYFKNKLLNHLLTTDNF